MGELNLLQKKIMKDGVIKAGNVLKVDSFLNHQIDVPFISELGKEFKKLFGDRQVDKILTIEASGIGIACLTAVYFGVPVLFAKKSAGSNMDKDVYATEVKSFTHNKVNHVVASKKYLNAGEHILIMDDFLANGCAVQGLIDLVKQAGGIVEGVGICIEKGFQGGGDELRASGIDVKSLAIIEKIGDKLDASAFEGKLGLPSYKGNHISFSSLKAGCLLTGIGLGLLVGFLISTVLAVGGGDDLFLSDGWRGWYRSDVAGTVYGASVLLFGGIGLLVSFVIEMNMKKKENK